MDPLAIITTAILLIGLVYLMTQFRGEPNIGRSAANNNNLKMVFLVRTDLEMTKGKVAAQCAHAAIAAYISSGKNYKTLRWRNDWMKYGCAKITLKCPNENLMLEYSRKAKKIGLTTESIIDAGRTQIAPGSRTVLAIGPGPVELVDTVTKSLKLY